VGLLGTVLGVIIAFRALGDAGQNTSAMGGVMNGIAEALVATGVGLFVALPAVVAYNVIQKRIADVETNAVSLTKLLTAYVKTLEGLGQTLVPPSEPQRASAAARADAAASPRSAELSQLPEGS
jgi:biopolymer transport protein ExbB/biopolymer transport protein TolQ